jgi:NADH-quinone oxidoreductase subunit A
VKQSSYECGLEVIGDVRVQLKVQYYLYAISYLIFGIELVFIYPVAVAFNQLDLFSLGAFFVFLILLILGLVYEWKKGVMEWI